MAEGREYLNGILIADHFELISMAFRWRIYIFNSLAFIVGNL